MINRQILDSGSGQHRLGQFLVHYQCVMVCKGTKPNLKKAAQLHLNRSSVCTYRNVFTVITFFWH